MPHEHVSCSSADPDDLKRQPLGGVAEKGVAGDERYAIA